MNITFPHFNHEETGSEQLSVARTVTQPGSAKARIQTGPLPTVLINHRQLFSQISVRRGGGRIFFRTEEMKKVFEFV